MKLCCVAHAAITAGVVLAIACHGGGGSLDGGPGTDVGDSGVGPDAHDAEMVVDAIAADAAVADAMLAPTPATVHDIDIGLIGADTQVTLTGLVVTGIARLDGTSSDGVCQYVSLVQDPVGPPPSGIKLYSEGPTCTPGDGSTCKCPFPPDTGSELDKVLTLDERVTVTGRVNVYAPAGVLIPTHEIVVASIAKEGTGAVTPAVFVNGSAFAKDSDKYQDYEGMLVTIHPATPAEAGPLDSYSGFDYAGAHFAGDYRFVYGHGVDPVSPAGTTFSSITGIANPVFHGGIAARTASDFMP